MKTADQFGLLLAALGKCLFVFAQDFDGVVERDAHGIPLRCQSADSKLAAAMDKSKGPREMIPRPCEFVEAGRWN